VPETAHKGKTPEGGLSGVFSKPRGPAVASWGRDMPKVSVNDPKHWRERAEQARTLADGLMDPEAKRRMLKLVGL
jgi:hypothetical protein